MKIDETVLDASAEKRGSLEPRQSVHLERLRALLRVGLAQDVVGTGLVLTYPRRPAHFVRSSSRLHLVLVDFG